MKKIFITILVLFFMVSMAHAHSVWINAFESTTHQPSHVMVSLGWGHALPMDDILNSPNGVMHVKNFDLIAPGMKKTSLQKPSSKISEPVVTSRNFDIFPGDLAVQKVAFKKDTKPGVYQFALASNPNFYTQYIDKKGKPRMKLKPKNEIRDIKKVLMSVKFAAFAKAYATVGKWTNPKPLGHALEIIPRTDLSNVHVGDLVEVDVLFYGTPLSATAKSIDYITAHSDSFGQSDGFMLFSYLMDGKAQFRVQSAGQWIISVTHKDDVTKDGPLKALFGKAEQVYNSATLTFTVK
ncbi:MAG: nickel transporter [Deltaproteobacteria bacterium]|nr:MAG: nickel transporter [Deltaproteobacteria bacterium]